MKTADLPPAPRYFPMDAEINRRGARPLEQLRPAWLSVAELRTACEQGAVVLDVRDATTFGAGHVPGAINIGLDGQFAAWAGTLLDPATPVILVAESEAKRAEAVTRLARVGLENVAGSLEGGFAAWCAAGEAIATLSRIDVHGLRAFDGRTTVVDVRRPGEYQAGHVPGAINLPLAELGRGVPPADLPGPVTVICAGGYRSAIGASLLRRHGYEVAADVIGGTSAWVAAGYESEGE
jgi:hydroxyacylglutathione hydrolase